MNLVDREARMVELFAERDRLDMDYEERAQALREESEELERVWQERRLDLDSLIGDEQTLLAEAEKAEREESDRGPKLHLYTPREF